MKRFWTWLALEYKRAVKIVPLMLVESVVLTGLVCMAVLAVKKSGENKTEQGEKPVIGVVAEENAKIPEPVISYLGEMESVKSLCTFQCMDYGQGKEAFSDGEISALIVLPKDMLPGILNGTNPPAAVYLPENLPAAGRIFQALTDAGIGMLQTAQAEIYAVSDVAKEYGKTDTLDELERMINLYNLSLVFGREKIFKKNPVSATENLSVVNYYLASGLTLYFLLMGLSFYPYFDKENRRCEKRLRVAGIPAAAGVLGKTAVVFTGLAVSGIFPFSVLVGMHRTGMLTLEVNGWKVAAAILCLMGTSAILVFCYGISKDMKGALLLIGMGGLLTGFLSGLFVPSVLLPEAMDTAGKCLPVYAMRKLWGSWFYDTGFPWMPFWETAGFTLLFFLISDRVYRRREEREA